MRWIFSPSFMGIGQKMWIFYYWPIFERVLVFFTQTLISFEHLQKILIFPKFQCCNSKIVSAKPFWILKFKWAWQTQFLSHNLVTLKNCVFIIDKQLILLSFFDSSTQKSANLVKPILSFDSRPQPVHFSQVAA